MEITREKYEKGRVELVGLGLTNGDVADLAERWGITVEPEPILPGVTGGDWEYECGGVWCHDGGKPKLLAKIIEVDGEESYNGKVMAGSKKLVALVGEYLRGHGVHESKMDVDLIDQLEKMEADVSKWR